jgi:DNA-binding response OmpR family regulator
LKILIVEDDDSVGRFLRQALVEAGHRAVLEPDGAMGLQLARDSSFELILLDVMLGSVDGFSICRRLRSEEIGTPILMLTARDRLEDKVEGLDAGADDYLVKPFQVAELLARVRALTRRASGTGPVLRAGSLTLDPSRREVRREGRVVELSATEYALLDYLMRNAGRTLTRSMILQHVWEYDFAGNEKVLDVYVSYLRRKIDDGGPSYVETIRGVGYRLRAPESRASEPGASA